MKVLITGATGKLGPQVVHELLARDVEVSALVRDAERARRILGERPMLVVGSFADTATVADALGEVDALCLLTPHGPDMAKTQNALIDLAAQSGTRVVKVSGTSSGIGPAGPDACRQHYDTEQHLAGSGVPWAVVRPNGYMQTLVVGMAATVRERGVVVNPLGGAGIAVVDCADVGAATAEVLCDRRHDGRHHVLTGPAAPTYAQMADDIGRVLGRAVAVVDVTPEQAGEAARAKGLSAWEAGHLAEMLHLFGTGAAEAVVADLPALIGRPPRTVADFVTDHRELFTS
ncbi:NAD(P)H-binding protein [Pseudonocardia xishanensis]|uniref:SDR family oxidoreductase n=1 Tax=Pseudonocardia xishanensis TaxID=630995 RepID=A0ABP8S262_9PSEU